MATADTIADGIAGRVPIPQALDDLQGLVSDWHILQAMRLAQRHTGLLLEPAGAGGLACVWAHRVRCAGGRVATVLCGSNLTAEHLQDILRSP